jgi:hypothetical protein
MDTRTIAAEYRLSHWAGIMREREESGLSIKAFCENAGFHENIYFYWQRKLREATCEELTKFQGSQSGLTPIGFTEVKLVNPGVPPAGSSVQGQICIEAAGVRITEGGEYPVEKLTILLREVSRPC